MTQEQGRNESVNQCNAILMRFRGSVIIQSQGSMKSS